MFAVANFDTDFTISVFCGLWCVIFSKCHVYKINMLLINGAIDVSGNATFGGLVDVNGVADGLVIDADGDTTISSPTDDQIDFEISGADDFTMTANTFTILAGSTIVNSGTMSPDITSTGKALVFGF